VVDTSVREPYTVHVTKPAVLPSWPSVDLSLRAKA